MKKMSVFVLAISASLGAKHLDNAALSKIGACSLEEVPELLCADTQDQEKYRLLYGKFLEQLNALSESRRHKKLQSVYNWSIKALRDKHLSFYKTLQRSGELDPETQSQATRTLLTRYAVYEKMNTVTEYDWRELKHLVQDLVQDYGKKVAESLKKATSSVKEWFVNYV